MSVAWVSLAVCVFWVCEVEVLGVVVWSVGAGVVFVVVMGVGVWCVGAGVVF